ncbi:uncharacterized protein LOC141673367 [Apium graveolens]|uniref:uncharacterized protein LOC141673367 n=1 Tax=Apium graveolens TaxID=4045 RepID=UPI003D7A0FCC
MEISKQKESSFGLSYPLLTKMNYTAWALKMKVFMQAHGVWDAIEPKESKDGKSTVENRVDKRALAVIYQGIPEELLLSIAEKCTAKDAWNTIKTVNLGADKVKAARAQTLKAEDWRKKECAEGQLLMTREEWLKRTKGSADPRGRDGNRGTRDRSKLRCFNCQTYGHFAYECRKPRRDVRDLQKEVILSKTEEEEPALLFTECRDGETGMIMLNEERMVPELKASNEGRDSQVWFLDNGANNHMTGQKGKFKDLDENVKGVVRFGDGSSVDIKGKGTVSFKCKNGEE